MVDAGYLASEVIRSGQNISLLANDANYITVVGAPVQSVNGLTGTVVLDADDISVTGTTNKFTTQAAITKLAGISTGAQLNTASNVGSGQGVYVSKVGSDLRFKSIVVSPVLSVSSTATEITLGKTAVVFNAHCGGVVQTVAQNVTVNALFGTIDTTHANYSYSAGVVTLSAAGVYEVSADITINANVVTVGIRLNGATQNGTIASAVGYSGAQTATTRTCRTFNAGSQISIAITGINGQITTVVNGCRILIRRIA